MTDKTLDAGTRVKVIKVTLKASSTKLINHCLAGSLGRTGTVSSYASSNQQIREVIFDDNKSPAIFAFYKDELEVL